MSEDEIVNLEDIITERIVGIDIKSQNEAAEDESYSKAPVIKTTDLKNGIISKDSIKIIKIPSDERSKRSSVVKGDVVISVARDFKAALIDESVEGAIISRHIIALRINDKIKPEVIVAYLNSSAGQKELNSRAAGTTMKLLSLKELLKIPIIIPVAE